MSAPQQITGRNASADDARAIRRGEVALCLANWIAVLAAIGGVAIAVLVGTGVWR